MGNAPAGNLSPRMTSSKVRRKVRKAKAEKASLQPPPPRNRGLEKNDREIFI